MTLYHIPYLSFSQDFNLRGNTQVLDQCKQVVDINYPSAHPASEDIRTSIVGCSADPMQWPGTGYCRLTWYTCKKTSKERSWCLSHTTVEGGSSELPYSPSSKGRTRTPTTTWTASLERSMPDDQGRLEGNSIGRLRSTFFVGSLLKNPPSTFTVEIEQSHKEANVKDYLVPKFKELR